MRSVLANLALTLLFVSYFVCASAAQVNITEIGVPITEDFNTLPVEGIDLPFENGVTLPNWYSTRHLMHAQNGNATAATNYSFGINRFSNERALGSMVRSLLPAIHQGVLLQNLTGIPIRSLVVNYTGEQWRRTDDSSEQSILFSYDQFTSMGELDLESPEFISFPPLDFASPHHSIGSSAALNGNLSENRRTLTYAISVNVPPGEFVFLRWSRLHTGEVSHGLAIDDVSITPRATPTAAGVRLSGRVLTGNGAGIAGATITVEGGGEPVRVRSGSFGAFAVEGLVAGQTYIVTVRNRKYVFAEPSRVFTLKDDLTDVVFVALDRESPKRTNNFRR